jgi:hypothetical protein
VRHCSETCINIVVTSVRWLAPLLLFVLKAYSSPTLTPDAARAFDRYTEAAEAAVQRDIETGHFLDIDRNAVERGRLRGGEVRIDPCAPPEDVDVVGGMIQDWRGVMFIPKATIQKVKAVLQDYPNYKDFYRPEVIESKQLAHQGDEYDIFLRLRKKQVLTVVLNSEYHVRYTMPDPRRMYVASRSTRIAEVQDPDHSLTEEEPVGHDSGFLWRLNSYWRFEEADGGVYAECRAISLSRDVPLGLGWMIKGFVTKFPKESMQNTLRGTKGAVERHSSF